MGNSVLLNLRTFCLFQPACQAATPTLWRRFKQLGISTQSAPLSEMWRYQKPIHFI